MGGPVGLRALALLPLRMGAHQPSGPGAGINPGARLGVRQPATGVSEVWGRTGFPRHPPPSPATSCCLLLFVLAASASAPPLALENFEERLRVSRLQKPPAAGPSSATPSSNTGYGSSPAAGAWTGACLRPVRNLKVRSRDRPMLGAIFDAALLAETAPPRVPGAPPTEAGSAETKLFRSSGEGEGHGTS